MKKTPPPIDAEPLQISPVAKRGEPTHLREPAHDMAKVIIDSPMIILLLDTQGNIQYINPYLEQLFDCELHQVRGKDWFANFVPQHAREKMRNRFQGAVKSSVVRTYSCSVLTPNHGECAVEWREQPIYDEQSCVIALLAVGLDYLRNAESGHSAKGTILAGMDEANRVQQIMQMMRFSIDHMEDKMTWTDGSGKIIYANAAACRSLGYTLEELLNLSVSDIDPDYSAEMWPQHWEDLKKRGSLTFESRHQNKKGEIHPVEVTVNYMQFEDAEYNCAYIRDITRRKEMEEALQLSSLVFQHSIEGMLVTDENNQIIAVNPAFSKITGYSFEEVKGKNPRIFQSGHHDQNFYRAMWHELLSTGQWQGEIWDHDKAGLVQIKWLTINTIYKDGGAHRYVALFFDITDKKQAEELILRQANFDTLTGLPNRNMLRQQVEQAMKEAQRTGRPMALLLVDLDQFKEVNDTLGHDVGDLLLQEVASRIRGSVRESDVVARLGGDEFTVVLSQVDDLSSAEAIAQKIVDSLSMPYLLGGESVFVTASIGITLYPDDGSDLDVLMKNADQAMYVGKNSGRNRYSNYTPALHEASQIRLRLTNDLRRALVAQQFSLYFQPIVELLTGRIHKVEALIRWNHPTLGMVHPQEFIALAEETGLINEMGDWVFKTSSRYAKDWCSRFDKDFQVSVNVSPLQFRAENPVFPGVWMEHLNALDLQGGSIILEITEGLLLNAEPAITDRLHLVRDAKIQVAIDDFGTGYSSLSYLKKFRIDYLKIDQSFVHDLETDASDMILIEAIILMAHKLGIKVIAEGVETEGQRNLLAVAGCDYAQGYLFYRPMPPEELEKLLLTKASKRKSNNIV